MIQCKLYARGSGSGRGGNQGREVADGADVEFTDTAQIQRYLTLNKQQK